MLRMLWLSLCGAAVLLLLHLAHYRSWSNWRTITCPGPAVTLPSCGARQTGQGTGSAHSNGSRR